MRSLLVLVVLLVAQAASAQGQPFTVPFETLELKSVDGSPAPDNWFRASLVAAVAAHGADLATTEFCLGAKTCRELNPFLLRFNQPGVFGAVKMGTAALSLWGTAKLHESHPKWAIVANVAQAIGFSAIAIRNSKVSSEPRTR